MNYEFKPLVIGRIIYTDRDRFDKAVRIAEAEPLLCHGIEIVYEPKAKE